MTQDPRVLGEAVQALETALALRDKTAAPLRWAMTQNNLGVALRWQGAVTGDAALLDLARAAYRACEDMQIKETAAFGWAKLQWNIADLALARHALSALAADLDTAEAHATAARAVFALGSDQQTAGCDDLLCKVAAARGIGPAVV